MQKTTSEEVKRVATIDRYRLIQQRQPAELRDLAMLAGFICDTPIAMVNILRRGQQHGIATWGDAPVDASRHATFCGRLVDDELADVFVIEDTTLDDRVSDLDAVRAGAHFYAGTRLVARNEAVLGTLCVFGGAARPLTAAQAFALKVIAREIVVRIEQHAGEVFTGEETPTSEAVYETVNDSRSEHMLAVVQSALASMHRWASLSAKDQVRMSELLQQSLRVAAKTTGHANAPSATRSNNVTNLSKLMRHDLPTLPSTHPTVVNCPPGLTVVGDNTDLRRLMLELLDNAVKFSPKGGAVMIDVERIGESVVIRVSDEGVGIPVGIDVFEAFARGNAAKHTPGDGLGLHVARTIVEQNGGRIGAWTTATGSTIGFTLIAV